MQYEPSCPNGDFQGERPGDSKVPGADSPTIRVAALANSLPRKVLSSSCSFSSFFASLCRSPQGIPEVTSSFWPMPLPFPEVILPESGFCVGSAKSWSKRLVSLAVAVMDWLHLGRPPRAPSGLEAGAPLSKRQWEMVELLVGLIDGGDFQLLLEPADLGRTAAKLEDHDELLGALHRAVLTLEVGAPAYQGPGPSLLARSSAAGPCGHSGGDAASPFPLRKPFGFMCGKLRGKKLTTAKAIQAHRISMPPAPSFDPVPFLDPKTADVYLNPRSHRLPHPREAPPLRSVVMAERREKLELFKLLAQTGRLGILDPREVGVTSGMFCVTKDMHRDRLILDGRGANVYEVPLNAWTKQLATAEKVAAIFLPAGFSLVASGRDLKDFFYQFKVSRERTARNALAGILDHDDLRYVCGDVSGLPQKAFVGLSTMAMGDCSACEYAQCSHLCALRGSGVFDQHELNTLTGPVPRGLLHIGVIIDDLIALERVANSWFDMPEPRPQTLSDVAMGRADLAYAGASLITNPSKAFQNQLKAKFWGIEMDGRRGTVRPSPTRFWPLVAITVRVIALGLCTVGLFRALSGSWTSVCLLRRRMLALMDLIFAAGASDEPERVVRLSPELKSELWTLVCLGPFGAVDLRAVPADFVTATDASSWGGAAVRAAVDPSLVLEFSRHSLSKGTWTRLLPPGKAWMRERGALDPSEELPDEAQYEPNGLANVLASALSYKEQWRKQFKAVEHINAKELRAYLVEESRIARSKGLRTLSGLDSQVALGCLTKGRSASKGLNRLLCASMGPYLGAGMYPHFMYFETSRNPADGPTRGKPPPIPSEGLPAWWSSALAGDFDSFDRWLAKQPGFQAGPDFSHVDCCTSAGHEHPPPHEVDCRPSAALKKQQREAAKQDYARDNRRTVVHPPGLLDDQPLGFSLRQFCLPDVKPDFTQPGALVLFTNTGALGRALLRHGAPWALTVDPSNGADQNLCEPAHQRAIIEAVSSGFFKFVSMAPPVGLFSQSVTPRARSHLSPQGFRWLRGRAAERVAEENQIASFCVAVIKACQRTATVWSLQHPDGSFLWRLPGFETFADAASDELWRGDMCTFGTPWRKRTRLATSSELRGGRRFCNCLRPHVVLRGRVPGRPEVSRTAMARPYPRGFAEAVAAAACRSAGWCNNRGKLQLGACARCGDGRIGEARNPGPRRGPRERQGDLEERPLQTATTLRYEDQLWEAFLGWCLSCLSDPCRLFSLVPAFCAMALRAYGNWGYSRGKTISSFRHTIIAAQRRVIGVKPYLSMAWEMVSRWEAVEPPVHRCPTPEPLVKAMVFLAISWDMHKWAAVTLLAFYGLARIGEVLRCRRRDVLLPLDLLDDDLTAIYLNFRDSKTATRGRPKVQHTRVTDTWAIGLISSGLFLEFRRVSVQMLFSGLPRRPLTDIAGISFCVNWTFRVA